MMMMMKIRDHSRSNPTVGIAPWDYHFVEDPTAEIYPPPSCADATFDVDAMAALLRYLPSNNDDGDFADDFDVPVDAFSCDNFRMFEFKVKKCALARSHDWTECPFAHPGEKARRRDPRKYHYSGGACPDFRRGECRRGDACEYAHGVFESWLHPARYRTLPCKDGTHCHRRVCFFAHTPDQLRVLTHSATSPEASPSRIGHDSLSAMPMFGSSPKSTLFSPLSPTTGSPPVSPNSVNQLAESMRYLQLNKMNMGLGMSVSPPTWGIRIGSPRSPPTTRPGFTNLPNTPIRARVSPGFSTVDAWGTSFEEEPFMERVESGRELRERIYAKLGKENSLNRVNSDDGLCPDFDWVNELVN
ncbi:hypothetical protein ABFS83_05G138200 [Erythranthe nasuta]